MRIEELFIKTFNMSLTASYVILSVIILRFLFKKAPKWIICILWGIAAFRLIFPFSLENILSAFSVIPASDIITRDILYSQSPTIHSGISVLNSTVNPIISESMAPSGEASVNPMQIAAYIASVIWLAGVAIFFIYSIFAYFKLNRRISTATIFRDNIYQSDNIRSPFMLGFFRPRIYIPFTLSEPELSHVIKHENAHILRRDYIIKPLSFIIVTLHWFNPLVWFAWLLFCRDIELACDEKVVKNMAVGERKSYSESLLALAMQKSGIRACPLAFSEPNVKERVKKALSYKKPAFWIIIAAFIACAATAVCLLTDPISKNETDSPDKADNFEPASDISQIYGTYHPSEVIYVNPISSFYPFELEYAPYYTLSRDELTVTEPQDGSAVSYGTPLYSRSKITQEEFAALFLTDAGIPDVSSYKNIEQIALTNEYRLFVLDDDLWIADFHGENVWLIYKLQASEPYSREMTAGLKTLSIDGLISLVEEKGKTLTWSDFEEYEHYDIGSGLYIWQIPINESFCVIVGGGGLSVEPMYIRMAGLTADGSFTDYSMDLLEDNINIPGFIDGFTDALRHLTWTYIPQRSSVFPALPISIDMEYSSVEAEVDEGSLLIHDNGITENFGNAHIYEYGEKIWWRTHSEGSFKTAEELFAAIADRCLLKLNIKNEQGDTIYSCQIEVRRISDENEFGYCEYSVELAEGYNSELALKRADSSWAGFVISYR